MNDRFNRVRPIGFRPSRFLWEEFDQLPREVRDAINSANFKWAAGTLLERFRKGSSPTQLVQMVLNADTAATKRAYAAREAEYLLSELGL